MHTNELLSNNGTLENKPKDFKIKKKKKKKKRCNFEGCRKKLTLTDMVCKCKCENIFCSAHRLPNNHNCSIVYKIDEKKFIENNGLGGGVHDKVIKI